MTNKPGVDKGTTNLLKAKSVSDKTKNIALIKTNQKPGTFQLRKQDM
jgi:hypothetical protein